MGILDLFPRKDRDTLYDPVNDAAVRGEAFTEEDGRKFMFSMAHELRRHQDICEKLNRRVVIFLFFILVLLFKDDPHVIKFFSMLL